MVFEECICTPIEKEGYHFVEWIGRYLGSCVWSPIEITSVAFGLANIVLWLFAQGPQLYVTFKLKKVEALHPLFLTTWLLGDITNLIGCILTQQLPVQLYTAIYFCFMDVLMLSQWVYYSKFYGRSAYTPLNREEPKGGLFYTIFGVLVFFGVFMVQNSLLGPMEEVLRGRVLLAVQDNPSNLPSCQPNYILEHWVVLLGDVLSWVSAILYFGARTPQILLNYRRKTVKGLSMNMFVMMCFANTFYGISIILQNPPINERFWASVFPFLLGSLGTLLGSSVVLFQWWYYDCHLANKLQIPYDIYDDEELQLNKKS